MTGAGDRSRRVRGAVLCATLGAVLLLFWPATLSLAALWADEDRRTYTHGFLVAAISLWLLWRNRALATRPDTQPLARPLTLLSFVALAVTVLLWQISYRAGLALATEVLLLPLMWFAVLLSLGRHAARAALVPIGYLVFALTVWDYANPFAQWLSVHAVRFMLRVVDVPAYFSGNDVHIASGVFEIAAGCSGLHFIVVALALAVLIGEVRGDRWRLRLGWCLLALALAMLANWVRIFIIILAGHLTHMQHYLVRESHYGFGWVVFAAFLFLLFVIERRTAEPRHRPPAATGAADAGPLRLAPWAVCIAILAVPVAQNQLIEARLSDSGALKVPERTLRAVREAGWSSQVATPTEWKPTLFGPDAVEQLRFLREGSTVETYRALYRQQKTGKKFGGQAAALQGEAAVIESGSETVGGRTYATRLLERDGRQSLMWFRYRAGDREFVSATRAQLWYSWETVTSARSDDSLAFAAWSPCEPDCPSAHATLKNFLSDIKDGM